MTRISPRASRDRAGRPDEGYILLTLVLVMATAVIASAIIAPSLAFEIRRDREEELVHRGVQYSRAIQKFFKKTGHYPANLNELQNQNGIRFIRKLYKDPVTGKDFKLIHMADMPGMGGTPGQGMPGSGAGGLGAPAAQANNSSSDSGDANADNSAGATPAGSAGGQNPARPAGLAPTTLASIGTTDTGSQPGLLIFGVASTSKAKTIREFDHKNHYKDWLFFYDPKYDRGGQIKGPTSTSLSNAAGLGPGSGQQSPPGVFNNQAGPPPPGAPNNQP